MSAASKMSCWGTTDFSKTEGRKTAARKKNQGSVAKERGGGKEQGRLRGSSLHAHCWGSRRARLGGGHERQEKTSVKHGETKGRSLALTPPGNSKGFLEGEKDLSGC